MVEDGFLFGYIVGVRDFVGVGDFIVVVFAVGVFNTGVFLVVVSYGGFTFA